jgi:hypothetical protein
MCITSKAHYDRFKLHTQGFLDVYSFFFGKFNKEYTYVHVYKYIIIIDINVYRIVHVYCIGTCTF